MEHIDVAALPPEAIDTAPAPPADGVVVRVAPTANPLLEMSQEDRMRLFIRVLCELVAYEPPKT